jgi:hypothetical protein
MEADFAGLAATLVASDPAVQAEYSRLVELRNSKAGK